MGHYLQQHTWQIGLHVRHTYIFFTVGLVRNRYTVDSCRFDRILIVHIISSIAVNPTSWQDPVIPVWDSGITESSIPIPGIGKTGPGLQSLLHFLCFLAVC